MTLENIFYTLGIIYIVGSLVVLIVVVILGIFVVRSLKKTKDEIESKIRTQLRPENLSITGLKAAAPVIITGAVGWLARLISQKFLKRS